MASMSLKGGLITGSLGKVIDCAERYGGGKEPYGRKVVFTDRGWFSSDKEEVKRYFKEGDVLTVREIYVGEYSSYVELVEVPSIRFSTAMFIDIETN